MPSTETGIIFENSVADTKKFNVFKYRNFYNGGGVAIGDINNDGLPDVYFTANQKKNKLYLNKGNFKFEDITDKSGVAGNRFWSTGVTMADVNADGWLDIYVCHSGDLAGESRENELFINQHNGKFTEEAKKYGLDEPYGLTTHAAFFDYDGDGDLDCYILNNSYRPIESFGYDRNLRNIRDPKGGGKLYRNDEGKFKDVSETAGIYGSEIGFGMGVTIGDVNGDKWPDIYISNDFFERDYLYINLLNGVFKEVLEDQIGSTSLSSMGADMADINNDGLMDIFSTDMLPEDDYRLKTTTKFDNFDVFNAKLKNDFHHQFTRNMLQLNNGNGTFSEIGRLANVYQTDWSWGALIFDFDNDGWNDLFVSNGISKDLTDQDYIDYFSNTVQRDHAEKNLPDFKILLDKMKATKIPNYAFINQKNLQFKNQSNELGLAQPSFSNGAAYSDLDNDGDLDLVVNNENMPCFVYKNRSNEKEGFNYLKVQLKGVGMNTYGIGTEVSIYTKEGIQVRMQMPSRGFESSVEPVLQFGLGKFTNIDSLYVIWPNQKKQILKGVKSNQTIILNQADANQLSQFQQSVENTLFSRDTTVLIGHAEHVENLYVDFDAELLLPAMISLEGPKCTTGDINGDGLEDMVLGGAKGDKVKMVIQRRDGKFVVRTSPEIQLTKQFYEDAGLALFDIDRDKDLDLMIASGGNEPANKGVPILQARLYINDGKGNFSNGIRKMPTVATNASCIRPYDFDGDGDTDVFIGGRSTPGNYGKIPPSYILQNDGKGNFSDVTAKLAPGILQAGMITDATWADIDGDKNQELIVSGEWMPMQAYSYVSGKFVRMKLGGVDSAFGWWNVVKAVDIDNDGDVDLIAGNLGLNSKFKADDRHPVEMYAADFDSNGSSETIITLYKNDSVSYPINLRGEMVSQLPMLKKKFLLHSEYAGKKINQVFTHVQLSKSKQYKANCFASCVFMNDGKGNFIKKELPVQAQFSPVYTILVNDFNKDGQKDIFVAGNLSGIKPETGRYDANYGQLYYGDGKGDFRFIKSVESGILLQGEARDAVILKTVNGKSYLVVTMNNERPCFFRFN
ncbi:MAG: VCBS repeat-containing protein [Chitinophagaceae bacterium]